MARLWRLFGIFFLLPLAAHAAWWMATDPARAWNEVDWSSSGILPSPRAKREALIHVYSARVGRWRGIFAVHTWIVVKERDGAYTRYDKTFWGNPVKTNNWAPDALWFGHRPVLVGAVEGPAAEPLIPKVRAAVAGYPYGHFGGYRIWPGPNSNTFVAHVLRAVPETGIAMPAAAVGKDWLPAGAFLAPAPSGTGWQVSLFGLIGATVAIEEGFELDVLGLTAGLDWRHPAIKLPGWGRIGVARPATP